MRAVGIEPTISVSKDRCANHSATDSVTKSGSLAQPVGQLSASLNWLRPESAMAMSVRAL